MSKRLIAFIVCLLITFTWGGILSVMGVDGRSQGLISLICYLLLVRFFWNRIVNNPEHIKILGVCFWLADKFDFDVSGIRILFVAATIFAIGSPVVIYFILYLVKPSQY